MRALWQVPDREDAMGRQMRLSPASWARRKWGRKSSGLAWLVVGSSLAPASCWKKPAWSSMSGKASSPNCTFSGTTRTPRR